MTALVQFGYWQCFVSGDSSRTIDLNFDDRRGTECVRIFLDAFDQHLALPPVFKRQFNLVAFLGSENCLSEREVIESRPLSRSLISFGQANGNPPLIVRKKQHDLVAERNSRRGQERRLIALLEHRLRSIPSVFRHDGWLGRCRFDNPVFREPPLRAARFTFGERFDPHPRRAFRRDH